MRKLLILFMASMQASLYAQTKSESDILFENAVGHISGIKRTYNPQLGKKMLDSAILLGNAKAMNAMANMYLKGIVVEKNMESCLYWYKRSMFFGNEVACMNLGNLYRLGNVVPQDFSEAVLCYKKGVGLNNTSCKTLLAYMYYKGLGTTQDYLKAFNLYTETANLGDENAMYFLGLCYRNGYGCNVNMELAKKWLSKASSKYDRQAMSELNEAMPENISVTNPYLQNQLAQLKQGKEKYLSANNNNYEGIYNGYAIYYDWSGQFVSEIQPIVLNLKKENGKYTGTWKEGDSKEAKISLVNYGNNLKFDEKSSYEKINHYSGRKPETWYFNKAKVELAFNKDSIQLSGFVQFYSTLRKEPSKPLQIILKKSMTNIDNAASEAVKFLLFPNPANVYTTVEFSLLKTAKVSFKIVTQNGVLIYVDSEKTLPQGTYNYNLPINNLIVGTYNVQLFINGKESTTNVLVKQ